MEAGHKGQLRPVDGLAVAAIALVAWAVFGTVPLDASDVSYSLAWGEEIAAGRLPDYEIYGAATPHPLHIALAAVGSVLGDEGAISFFRALTFLALSGLIWFSFRLGQASFAPAVGVLAAILVATDPQSLGNGTADSFFIPTVLVAAWLEAARPRRGTAVLVVLAFAGLLRPEAWILAGAYWLHVQHGLDTRRRLELLALTLAAPVIWALTDLLVTGDPLYSLTLTQNAAVDIGRVTGITNVPHEFVVALRELLRPVVYIGGFVGLVLSLRLRRAGAAVPAVLVACGAVNFVALGLADLPLNDRYLRLLATALTILLAFALLGWRAEAEGPLRRGWAAGSAVVAIGLIAFVPVQLDNFRELRDRNAARTEVRDDLTRVLRAAEGDGALERCRPLNVVDRKLIPLVAYLTGTPLREVPAAELRPPPRGLFVVPATAARGREIVTPEQLARTREGLRSGFEEVARNRSWRVYSRNC